MHKVVLIEVGSIIEELLLILLFIIIIAREKVVSLLTGIMSY